MEKSQEKFNELLEAYKVSEGVRLLNDKAKVQRDYEKKIKNIDSEIATIPEITTLPEKKIQDIMSSITSLNSLYNTYLTSPCVGSN